MNRHEDSKAYWCGEERGFADITTFCNSEREMKKAPSDREVINGTYNKARLHITTRKTTTSQRKV
jgi:hypothetical protein